MSLGSRTGDRGGAQDEERFHSRCIIVENGLALNGLHDSLTL
jgi:hypothetical protein